MSFTVAVSKNEIEVREFFFHWTYRTVIDYLCPRLLTIRPQAGLAATTARIPTTRFRGETSEHDENMR